MAGCGFDAAVVQRLHEHRTGHISPLHLRQADPEGPRRLPIPGASRPVGWRRTTTRRRCMHVGCSCSISHAMGAGCGSHLKPTARTGCWTCAVSAAAGCGPALWYLATVLTRQHQRLGPLRHPPGAAVADHRRDGSSLPTRRRSRRNAEQHRGQAGTPATPIRPPRTPAPSLPGWRTAVSQEPGELATVGQPGDGHERADANGGDAGVAAGVFPGERDAVTGHLGLTMYDLREGREGCSCYQGSDSTLNAYACWQGRMAAS